MAWQYGKDGLDTGPAWETLTIDIWLSVHSSVASVKQHTPVQNITNLGNDIAVINLGNVAATNLGNDIAVINLGNGAATNLVNDIAVINLGNGAATNKGGDLTAANLGNGAATN